MSRGRGESERGSVAITVALSLTVLLGFAALVVDIGLNWATRTSAQTAADSAALAGASSLLSDGGVAAITTVEDLPEPERRRPGRAAGRRGLGDRRQRGERRGRLLDHARPGARARRRLPGRVERAAGDHAADRGPVRVRARAGQDHQQHQGEGGGRGGAGGAQQLRALRARPGRRRGAGVLGLGGIEVDGGGIVVNSDDADAVVLDQRRRHQRQPDQGRRGGRIRRSSGHLLPPAEEGGPPVPDPLADLPTPDELTSPPTPEATPVRNITGPDPHARRLRQHQRERRRHPDPGGRGLRGHRVLPRGPRVQGDERRRVESTAASPSTWPARTIRRRATTSRGQVPAGRRGRVPGQPAGHGRVRGAVDLRRPRQHQVDAAVRRRQPDRRGVHGQQPPGRLPDPAGAVQIDSLLVVDRLQSINLDPLQVNYDPSLPLLGVGVPVLI